MQHLPIAQRHTEVLEAYGLQQIPLSECLRRVYAPGETIVRAGMPITGLSITLRGRAKVFRVSEGGKTLIVCQYASSGMIGEIELLTGSRSAITTVTAVTEFECIRIGYDRCLHELKTNIVFSNALGAALAAKLAGTADASVSLALYSGKQRLCSYILQNAPGDRFDCLLTEVAASIGMSYRHMFRLLNELCGKRILEKREDGYRVLNRPALYALSCKE